MNAPEGLDRLLGIAAASAVTSLSAATIWRYVRDGKFPPPRYVANRRVWLESTLRAWIEAEAAKPRRRQGGRLLNVPATGTP